MKWASFYNSMARFFIGVTVAFAGNAFALEIDYGNTTGGSINFNGSGGFSFNPSSDSLLITSGSAVGLQGEISGTFSIGSITTVGLQSSASVSGSGEFVIHDGASTFKGTLTIGDIVQQGTGVILNDLGTINLTGINYNGTNPDLLAL